MYIIAVSAPMLWLMWMIAINWVPMSPLNNLTAENRRDRITASAINYPFLLAIIAGVVLYERWSLITSLALCVLILGRIVLNWWLPYFFGIHTAAQYEIYQRDFAATLTVLPERHNRITPDVQRMVLTALSLAMFTTTLIATLTV